MLENWPVSLRSNLAVVDPESCWVWAGNKDRDGYGRITLNYKTRRVHRVVWELEHGPIPSDLIVMHVCDNPPCANPAHLRLGTHKDNAVDRAYKGHNRKQKIKHSAPLTLEIRKLYDAGHQGLWIAATLGLQYKFVRMVLKYRNSDAAKLSRL